jgi:alpha-glucuronidase
MNHRFRCSCIILFIFYSCISHLYGQVQAVSTVDTGYELWLNYKSGSNSRLKQAAIRYASQVRFFGGVPVPVPTSAEKGFVRNWSVL